MQDAKYILPCLIVVQLWLSLGTGFLSFIAGLQTVDKSLYEAAALDGVKNRWQELWYVTLPAMKPQLMFGAVMQITQSFAVADISIQLAGNPSVNYAGATVVTHLWIMARPDSIWVMHPQLRRFFSCSWLVPISWFRNY